jgi:hypothetical protein
MNRQQCSRVYRITICNSYEWQWNNTGPTTQFIPCGSPSWKTNSYSAGQEIPHLLHKPMFTAASTTASHWSLSWVYIIKQLANWVQHWKRKANRGWRKKANINEKDELWNYYQLKLIHPLFTKFHSITLPPSLKF